MNRIKTLLLQMIRGEITQEGQEELGRWVAADERNKALYEEIQNEEQVAQSLQKLSMLDEEQNWERLQEKLAVRPMVVHRVHFLKRFRWVAAAILIGVMAVGGWLLLREKQEVAVVAKADVRPPSTNRAHIQLANGTVVYLDSAANGQLAILGNVKLEKLADGRIVYTGNANELAYHTLTNPKGSLPIDIGLSDGSHVWLNAGSSVTYPVAFVKNKSREVSMTGEAIFKVVHNESDPFRVKAKDQVIEDIGTEFNINAYDDEPEMRTTLIEGVASVTAGKSTIIVNAGKQAQIINGALTIADADVDKAIAWRSGQFNFEGADIRTIGRQLQRWYNIDVEYKAGLPTYHFGGGTFMNSNLNEVLKVLELGGVHFILYGPTEDGAKAKLVVIP